ncbi:DUF3828 domain-containing protein [Novosphingobium aquimarinum]|uniref:DUF3828 domain-containing protein n=1 Tax=Novosphingobium aquimarinum TaxID=2682494 RepID=UPI0012EB3EAC|nr:DUF3828 domain-containing protein [Novosphingobium aquimarinum]
MRKLLICVSPLLAPAPVLAGDPEMEAAIDALYAPYFADTDDLEATLPAWERPIFSKDLAALVERWHATLPANEADDLSGADWLCQCQDWDASTFSTEVFESTVTGNTANANVRIVVFPGAEHKAAFHLVREDGAWKIDDLVASDFPDGLRQKLREVIQGHARQ